MTFRFPKWKVVDCLSFSFISSNSDLWYKHQQQNGSGSDKNNCTRDKQKCIRIVSRKKQHRTSDKQNYCYCNQRSKDLCTLSNSIDKLRAFTASAIVNISAPKLTRQTLPMYGYDCSKLHWLQFSSTLPNKSRLSMSISYSGGAMADVIGSTTVLTAKNRKTSKMWVDPFFPQIATGSRTNNRVFSSFRGPSWEVWFYHVWKEWLWIMYTNPTWCTPNRDCSSNGGIKVFTPYIFLETIPRNYNYWKKCLTMKWPNNLHFRKRKLQKKCT